MAAIVRRVCGSPCCLLLPWLRPITPVDTLPFLFFVVKRSLSGVPPFYEERNIHIYEQVCLVDSLVFCFFFGSGFLADLLTLFVFVPEFHHSCPPPPFVCRFARHTSQITKGIYDFPSDPWDDIDPRAQVGRVGSTLLCLLPLILQLRTHTHTHTQVRLHSLLTLIHSLTLTQSLNHSLTHLLTHTNTHFIALPCRTLLNTCWWSTR